MFKKSRIARWRDTAFSAGLFLFGLQLVLVAFRTPEQTIVSLILQISACAVLLAAAGLGLFLLSSPTLHIDKFGVAEKGHLLGDFNWSMTWNEIAYAELVGELRGRVHLVGLDSEEVEHTLAGYERFETLLTQLAHGLKKYGRRLVEPGDPLPFHPPRKI